MGFVGAVATRIASEGVDRAGHGVDEMQGSRVSTHRIMVPTEPWGQEQTTPGQTRRGKAHRRKVTQRGLVRKAGRTVRIEVPLIL